MKNNKKKKILIVHNYYQIPGGEDTVVENEKRLLEENGHNVILYSRSNSELKNINKFQQLLLPFITIFNMYTYREVQNIIRKNDIDILHVHNTLNLISPSVYYAALTCNIPVVQTIHNFRMVCPGATFYRDGKICEDCLSKGILCSLKHSCYRGSRLQTLGCVVSTNFHKLIQTYKKINYICLTEFTRDKLLNIKQINPEQVYVKPNFTYDQGGNADAKGYYIFVGRLEEIKGIELLIDAFKLMPDKKLKIVGTGILKDKIYSRLRNEQIHNIELLGYKNREEINELLRGANALVMCSQWYETFGMVIVEAYSNGIPVIVGKIGNIKDLVIEGKTGELFDYDSVESLIRTIDRFENNSDKSYGVNGYNWFKSYYSPEVNYNILMKVYSSIV